MRWHTVSTLKEFASHRQVKQTILPLIKMLADEDNYVRQIVTEALGEFAQYNEIISAVEPLTKALSDENEWIQQSAAKALEQIRKQWPEAFEHD